MWNNSSHIKIAAYDGFVNHLLNKLINISFFPAPWNFEELMACVTCIVLLLYVCCTILLDCMLSTYTMLTECNETGCAKLLYNRSSKRKCESLTYILNIQCLICLSSKYSIFAAYVMPWHFKRLWYVSFLVVCVVKDKSWKLFNLPYDLL